MLSSELILIHTYLPNAPVNWTLSQNLCEIHLRWFLLQLTAFFSCSQNLYGNLFCRTAGSRFLCLSHVFYFRLKTVVFVLYYYSFVSLPFGYAVVSLPGSFLCGVRTRCYPFHIWLLGRWQYPFLDHLYVTMGVMLKPWREGCQF